MYQTPLKVLLQMAYQLPAYRISGPGWIESERYDVLATIPPETPDDKVLLMLQSLLEDRFHLVIHWESRETPCYVLLVDKKGPRLEVATPGTVPIVRPTPSSLVAQNRSMRDLAGILMRWTDRPVVDMTGLPGSYNFKLDWRSPSAASISEDSPLPLAGIRDSSGPLQALAALGLRAEARRVRLDFLIVDRASKDPGEN
jgi:uncharacterized protein (TIGR03435 family)